MKNYDYLRRFIFDGASIRGELLQLRDSYQEVLKRHPYPLSVQKLLGQALASVSLLSATLKYQGKLILQAQGDGALSLLLAQANAQQQIRGLAKWEGNVSTDFTQAIGRGHLALTIDLGQGNERYQGIVELKGNSLAKVIENYFYQSEQLPTMLFLASDDQVAAGLLLQLLPEQKQETALLVNDYWQHISYLAATIKEEELLGLSPESILHRLFHQEKITILSSQEVEFVCQCSRDAMAKAIVTLGYEEATILANEQQVVSVTCEFCNKQLDFDRVDIERIFLPQNRYSNRDDSIH